MRVSTALAVLTAVLLLSVSCAEKAPSRDEIPLIKNLLGKFQVAVKEHNQAKIDSLMASEALDLGYSSLQILSDVYGPDSSGEFFAFGGKEIAYVEKKGTVKCRIVSDSASLEGIPVEITIVKKGNVWLVKRFDLQ